MYKLRATLLKDFRILARDRVGLTLMFVMPIVLAIVITAVQNSTFELVNDNKVALILSNRDGGFASKQLVAAITRIGMFEVKQLGGNETDKSITERMQAKDALVAIIIPPHFSATLEVKANAVAAGALRTFGLPRDSTPVSQASPEPVTLYYHPVLQEAFRASIRGALRSALQLVQNKQVLKSLYYSLNQAEIPDSFENQIVNGQAAINEIPVSRNGSRNIPNATQHNIPAWTIFAMFFVVISLGSSVVREKLNGSFIRLKTLPTSYLLSLFSKQLTYLAVTLLQTAVIFSLGVWLFPVMGLPALNIPSDFGALVLVTLCCGWCAVSFAICVGVFAETQEQANGFGAVSVVLLAAVGGILVPSFAMPASFRHIMLISPLHWCLEAFYGLFLEGGKLNDVLVNILPLIGITLLIQVITAIGLKRKHLV